MRVKLKIFKRGFWMDNDKNDICLRKQGERNSEGSRCLDILLLYKSQSILKIGFLYFILILY